MFQSGPLGLFGSLGSVAKIVLFILFLFSVTSWVIILSKWLVFRSSDREDKSFLSAYAQSRDNEEVRREPNRPRGPTRIRVANIRTAGRRFDDGQYG